jgi:protocatechuate 3,4-dioxygenase beta subunit
MASSTSRAIALALVLGLWVINGLAQTPGPQKASKPTGSISGRVTSKDKGLSGIGIVLRRTNQSNPFDILPRATTDQDGNYKISNLDPGTYEVRTSLTAYVISDNDTGAGRPVIVMEGENIEEINFSMVKGGVITGRITDADGGPVIQQQVRLFRAEPPDTRVMGQSSRPRVNYPVSNSVTDDRGIYRIFGLRAGRYQVSTGRSETTIGPPSSPPGRMSYKEVFYPDATDQAKAAVLEVNEGSETSNIDIVVGRPLQTYSASGRIIDGERGEPIPGMRYGVQRILTALDRTERVNSILSTDSAGDFVVEGLIPGKYSVFAFTNLNSEFRTDGTTFDIVDSDVTGITIRLIKGGSISGVVVLESDDKRATAKLSQFQLMAFVQGSSRMGGRSSQSPINPDGSFRVGGLAEGMAMFSLNATMQGAMKELTVTRIEREGVVQRGIEIKDGEHVTGVRVIVAYGDAVLRGIVNIENGPLPTGARIMVHLAKPGDPQPVYRPPMVDDRGRFITESLPPGTYELVVSVFVPGVKPQPPVKQQVTLQNGVTTEVTVPFILASSPNP